MELLFALEWWQQIICYFVCCSTQACSFQSCKCTSLLPTRLPTFPCPRFLQSRLFHPWTTQWCSQKLPLSSTRLDTIAHQSENPYISSIRFTKCKDENYPTFRVCVQKSIELFTSDYFSSTFAHAFDLPWSVQNVFTIFWLAQMASSSLKCSKWTNSLSISSKMVSGDSKVFSSIPSWD